VAAITNGWAYRPVVIVGTSASATIVAETDIAQNAKGKKGTIGFGTGRPSFCLPHISTTHEEFIRRFALHILPFRFVKIRHFGFLSSTWKRKKLKALQEKLGIQSKM